MSYPRRRTAGSGRRNSNQDFWLSFSDLMSVLVLVFILVLFYILYKYQDELDKMLLIEAALNEKQTELDTATAALSDREEEITEAQTQMAKQQLMLNLAKQAVADSEEKLADKQGELDDALSLIEEREDALAELEEQLSSQQTRIDDQQAQLDYQQSELEALVGVRTRIIENLSAALKQNNISATVDPANGSIMLESDVLFEYGSAELSATGKAYVDQFLPVYLSVLLSEENSAYVSEIIIEGHTDPKDTYIKNLKLSQNRAYAVAEYVLENSWAVSSSKKAQLKSLLTANGRSYSDPILDENGRVDEAASRRVVFKFRLLDDQMVEQMKEILENTALQTSDGAVDGE